MSRLKLTKAEIAKTISLRKKGLLVREMAVELKISPQAVSYRLRKLGFEGALTQKCDHCKKHKNGMKTKPKWGKICRPCYKKLKRTKNFEWSCDFACCKRCSRTDRVHKARGLCSGCEDNRRYNSDSGYRKRRTSAVMRYHKTHREKRLKSMRDYARKRALKK